MIRCVAIVALSVMFHSPAHAVEWEQWDDRWYDQKVDHFDAKSTATFEQHVKIYKPGGVKITENSPVVLELGNEFGTNTTGLKALAQVYGAGRRMIFAQVEHRGYGSYPKDVDQTIPSYLTVNQAVEDFHVAIQNLRKEFTGPLIVVGFSYAGGVAAKLALKYPEDMDVVISSSGVMEAPFVFDGHDQMITKHWPEGVRDNLIRQMQDMKPAVAFDTNWFRRTFMENMLAGATQLLRSQSLVVPAYWEFSQKSANDLFSKMLEFDRERTGGFVRAFTDSQGLEPITWEEMTFGKPFGHYYDYQRCYEIGTFFSGGPFTTTADEFRDYCEKRFGKRPKWKKKPGLNSKMKNVKVPFIAVTGDRDPWYSLGIQNEKQIGLGKLIHVPGGFHCQDREDPAVAAQVMDAAFSFLTNKNCETNVTN